MFLTWPKRTDSGENPINENKAGSTSNEVLSNLPEEFSTKEDEIQTNVVASNKTMDLAICQDPKIGLEQYFDKGDILKDDSINNLTDHQKYRYIRTILSQIALTHFPNHFNMGVIAHANLIIYQVHLYTAKTMMQYSAYIVLCFVIVIQDPNCRLL